MSTFGIGVSPYVKTRTPNLGFLGVGWIGQNRMRAVAEAGIANISAIYEPSEKMASAASEIAHNAKITGSMDELFSEDLDGIVIATPSALHAVQCVAALERGISVFCQKPLGRTAEEAIKIVDAARKVDRFLGVDFSYRDIEGVPQLREIVRSGELGTVFSVDLVFHNAYGPDKEWFFDRTLSGGGCLLDLGVHLLDLAMWAMDYPNLTNVNAAIYSKGKRLTSLGSSVEDFATARLAFGDTTVNIACSWNLNAGVPAEIGASFYGTHGAVRFHNVGGSFFDFTCKRMNGTSSETLGSTGDNEWEWGGRAIVNWIDRLSKCDSFDPECEKFTDVAAVMDQIYSAAAQIQGGQNG
jgi:predicted dehydrogenase